MKIELTGVRLPKEHNQCCVSGCDNGADTAVWEIKPGRSQRNVCMYHLKEKTESGEWQMTNFRKEMGRLKGGYE
jgi:hypothetical protein